MTAEQFYEISIKFWQGVVNKSEHFSTSGDFTVLCAQAYLGTGDVPVSNVSNSATSTAVTSNVSPAPSSNGDLSSRVEMEVLQALSVLASQGKLPIKRALINGTVVGKFPGVEMGQALSHLNNESWMGSSERPWKLNNGELNLG